MSSQLLKMQFTVTQYHRMNEAGILTEDDRVELIKGEIIKMSPIGTRHTACVKRLVDFITRLLQQAIIISVQYPILLSDLSEPQPDIALLKRRADFYETGHPQPQDILLLIEVADSSIEYDRDVKIPLYAESGILEVWLVDINQQVIEIYRQPTPTGYREIKTFNRGENLSIQAFLEFSLNVNNVLG
ncbi:MAG TPA: Uma2 family endonuclease [Nostocaceae cyanobacterium]|nr:Uma2 family endonuclease [Nostocaceae cyanobacterium]